MNQKITCAISLSLCVLTGSFFLQNEKAIAQIAPDNSLGTESSTVVPNVTINGIPADRIEGGARRGNLLFHSFEDFNVEAGEGAYFLNPAAVNTIFSRVTGANVSNIFGTLGVLGDADLVFLNPAGLLFGSTARLDLRGSFAASTANSVIFPNGESFSALDSAVPSVLAVNTTAPVGLVLEGIGQGPLTNEGLLVAGSEQRLILLGDTVVNRGGLAALGGDIVLSATQDVALIEGSFLNVLGTPGGRISVQAQNIEILNSGLFAGLESFTSTGAQSGNIELDAQESILIAGSTVVNSVRSAGMGDAGDISIKAAELLVTGGSTIAAVTQGRGNAGRVEIDVSGSALFSQSSTVFNSLASSDAVGSVGGITIEAASLILNEGAEFQTSSRGQGNGGNIVIQVRNLVDFSGIDSAEFPSGLFSGVKPTGIGDGGEITIVANALSIADGAQIQSKSEGVGGTGDVNITLREDLFLDGAIQDPTSAAQYLTGIFTTVETNTVQRGGDLSIQADSLTIMNGAELTSNTFGLGDSGNIDIDIREDIVLDGFNSRDGISGIFSAVGRDNAGNVGQGKGGNIGIDTGSISLIDGGSISAGIDGNGESGEIFIAARESISLAEGAGVFVESQGSGTGGNIDIRGRNLFLDRRSILSAETQSSTGGNIDLSVSGILRLGQNSQISTTAGANQAGGDGGNIIFNGGFIFANPQENSDITANAFEGAGGTVDIAAAGVFGIAFREALSPLSDITASSAQGSPGIVTVNAPEVNPTQGIVTLPEEPRSTNIADSCQTVESQDAVAFFNLGRGGTLPSPEGGVSPVISTASWISPQLTSALFPSNSTEALFSTERTTDFSNEPPLSATPAKSTSSPLVVTCHAQ